MNDPSAVPAAPTAPPIIGAVSPTVNPEPPPLPKPFSWWLRKLFACNPFYLVSAALLLYGCYRLSIDTAWFHGETARLFASFTSVQGYELLLVSTAIFLARRSLWYDSTLLVGLENLLVFVPFILISQAALTDSHMAQGICITGAGLALLRFGSLKKFFTQLNLPGRLLGMGTLLLALNVALPLIYRHYGETKIGVHMDSGPAYEMNEYTWLLILPAALALGNFLPCARALGNLPHQHRWLPDGLFGLWVIATIMHVYCLDYIYHLDLRPDLIAPGLWILAWMGWLNFPEKSNRWHTVGKLALETAPLLISVGGVQRRHQPGVLRPRGAQHHRVSRRLSHRAREPVRTASVGGRGAGLSRGIAGGVAAGDPSRSEPCDLRDHRGDGIRGVLHGLVKKSETGPPGITHRGHGGGIGSCLPSDGSGLGIPKRAGFPAIA